jgi:orotidine-5'-phosphate decarboxylase
MSAAVDEASFGRRLARRVAQTAPVCVGIDPHLERVPGWQASQSLREQAAAVEAFGLAAVEAVRDRVAAVKPQVAFFEQLGSHGVGALEAVCAAARERGLLVLVDAKRGDIGSTARAYAMATLDDRGPLRADAVTLSPYLGPESLAPFADYRAAGKGLFVLLRTSNPGAGPWQRDTGLAERVAAWVVEQNADGRNAVGVVLGATLPAEAPHWRRAVGDAWVLVPGFGAQGAGPDDVRGHFLPGGGGALVTSSRGLLFPQKGYDAEPVVAIRARTEAMISSLGDLCGS